MSEPRRPEAPPAAGLTWLAASRQSLTGLLVEQQGRWRAGERPRVEDYLARHPDLAGDAEAVLDLIGHEVLLRRERGEPAPLEEYLGRFPHLAEPLRIQFEVDRALDGGSQATTIRHDGDSLPGPPAGLTPALSPSQAERVMTALGDVPPDPTLAGTRPAGGPGRSALPAIPGYEVEDFLARGGMGAVYKARQISLNRPVALKMILSGEYAGEGERRRFRAEAEAVARLQHPNVVQIYEVGEHAGRPYLALEYLDGGSLAQHLNGVPQPARPAAALVATLARAMHSAHQKGIVHRDLKPANILLTFSRGPRGGAGGPPPPAAPPRLSEGIPKIADFGLAKRLEGATGLTQTGAILGTPGYMAPEQAAGKNKQIGPAADVYALGAILYELLTGRPPFRAETPLDTVLLVLAEDPVPPRFLQPRLPRDLETICLKCLAREPEGRYPSALALAEDLDRWERGEPILARRQGLAGRLWRKVRPHRVVAVAALLVCAAAAVAGYFVWRQGEADAEARRARRLATLQRAFETGLDANDWGAEHLKGMDGLLADLDRLAPGEAAEARRRLDRHFAAAIKETIHRPRLTREDVARSEEALGRLAARAPGLAAPLRATLRLRLQDRETVIDLQAPFADRDAVFDPGQVKVAGNALHVAASPNQPPGAAAPVVLTRVSGGRYAQLEAVFGPSWGACSEIGLLLNATRGHTREVNDLAFAPGGGLLASAGSDGTVIVWDTARGEQLRILADTGGNVACVAFHPDGTRLAAGTDADLRIWDVATGRRLAAAPAHPGRVGALAFSPDGKTLATAGAGGAVRLWDLATGRPRVLLEKHPHEFKAVGFTDQGQTLLAVDHDKNPAVLRWDLATGARRDAHITCPYSGGQNHVALSRDGRHVAVASWPTFPWRLWDAATGRERVLAIGEYSKLAFSPDGKTLAAGWSVTDLPGKVTLYDIAPVRCRGLMRYSGPWISAVAYSPDGLALASAGGDGVVTVWDVATGMARYRFGVAGYLLRLTVPPADPAPGQGKPAAPPTMAAVCKAGGALRLQIVRNGVRLREQEVRLAANGRDLTLRATRNGEHLTAQVNNLPPLALEDLFPHTGLGSGRFGLAWPAAARLRRLHASRPALTPAGSPLERGDALLGRGRYQEALAAYRQQAAAAGAGPVGQEARCKAALCLEGLGRGEEAAALFERVAAENGPRWPLVAACQLWLYRLRQPSYEDDGALLASLSARYRAQELAALIPDDVRDRLLEAHTSFERINYLFYRPAQLRRLEQAVALADLLHAPPLRTLQLKTELMHGYGLLDRRDQAQQAARTLFDWITSRDSTGEMGTSFVGHGLEQACWFLRRSGDPRQVLEEVDRALYVRPGVTRPDRVMASPLLLERARLHLALKQPAEAEKDLAAYFRLTRGVPDDLNHFSSACLMDGFLRAERGDEAGALAAWKRGRSHAVLVSALSRPEDYFRGIGPKGVVNNLVLGSLANDLTDAEARGVVELVARALGGGSLVGKLMHVNPLPPALFRGMYRSPRGRAFARRLAFRDLSFRDFIRGPLYLLVTEMYRQQGFGGRLAGEEEALAWGLSRAWIDAFLDGRLDKTAVINLALTWQGFSGSFGWAGVADKLSPQLRGPAAYVFGHRYLRLKKPKEAETFFRTALADAPPEAPLRRLARAELDRLKAK